MKKIIQVDHGKVRLYTNVKKIFFLILVLAGCQSGNKESRQEKELPVIDLSKNYPERKIRLQDVADVEFIPLETTDEVLMSDLSIIFHISEKYIFVYEMMKGSVFIFHRNGKIFSHFNRMGQGGEEYIGVSNATLIFDEKEEEIYVFGIDKILVYSLYGDFKRKLIPKNVVSIYKAYIFDDETLLVYFEDYNFSEKTNQYPYKLISKKSGDIVHEFNIHLPVRYQNRIVQQRELPGGQPGTYTTQITICYNMQWAKDFVIADRSSDTIYRLTNNRDLTPILVRKPSVHSSEPRKVWNSFFTTDKFMLFQTNILDLKALEDGKKGEAVTLIYDFETGETNNINFDDVDLQREMWLPHPLSMFGTMPKNTTCQLMTVDLLKFYQKYKLNDYLDKLVSSLDDEDNPVAIIYTFK